jgi:hypothetical protein
MAVTNTNSVYLSWNGFNISGYWAEELNYEPSVDSEDMTAGAGATHVARLPKLKDNKMGFMVMYDDSTIATYVQNLKEGTVGTLIYGPEGSTTGKPCFTGSMLLESIKFSQSVDKKKLAFEVSFLQAATPTKTIQNGDTF